MLNSDSDDDQPKKDVKSYVPMNLGSVKGRWDQIEAERKKIEEEKALVCWKTPEIRFCMENIICLMRFHFEFGLRWPFVTIWLRAPSSGQNRVSLWFCFVTFIKIGFGACQFCTNQKLTQILYAVHMKTPASSTKNVLLKKEIFTMVRKEFVRCSLPSDKLYLLSGC